MAKIVQILDENGTITLLDEDGRIWYESHTGWLEYRTYPPGCDPQEQEEEIRLIRKSTVDALVQSSDDS